MKILKGNSPVIIKCGINMRPVNQAVNPTHRIIIEIT